MNKEESDSDASTLPLLENHEIITITSEEEENAIESTSDVRVISKVNKTVMTQPKSLLEKTKHSPKKQKVDQPSMEPRPSCSKNPYSFQITKATKISEIPRNSVPVARVHPRVETPLVFQTWMEWCSKISEYRPCMESEIKKLCDFFKCSRCNYTTNKIPDFRLHIKTNHLGLTSVCLYCLVSFRYCESFKLIDHILEQHAHRIFQCGLCLYRSSCFPLMDVHIESFHNTDPPIYECNSLVKSTLEHQETSIDIETIQPYKCMFESCLFATLFTDIFTKHCLRHSKTRNFSCYYCNQDIKDGIKGLHSHFTTHGIYLYHCGHCSFGDNSLVCVKSHMSLNHADLPFTVIKREEKSMESSSDGNEVMEATELDDSMEVVTRGEPERIVEPATSSTNVQNSGILRDFNSSLNKDHLNLELERMAATQATSSTLAVQHNSEILKDRSIKSGTLFKENNSTEAVSRVVETQGTSSTLAVQQNCGILSSSNKDTLTKSGPLAIENDSEEVVATREPKRLAGMEVASTTLNAQRNLEILKDYSLNKDYQTIINKQSGPVFAENYLGPFVCGLLGCKTAISNLSDYKRHLSHEHASSTIFYPCPHCTKITSDYSDMENHLNLHGPNLYQCGYPTCTFFAARREVGLTHSSQCRFSSTGDVKLITIREKLVEITKEFLLENITFKEEIEEVVTEEEPLIKEKQRQLARKSTGRAKHKVQAKSKHHSNRSNLSFPYRRRGTPDYNKIFISLMPNVKYPIAKIPSNKMKNFKRQFHIRVEEIFHLPKFDINGKCIGWD